MLHKHEDPDSGSQNTQKSRAQWHMPLSMAQEGRDEDPSSLLVSWSKPVNEIQAHWEILSKNIKTCPPLPSTCMYIHVHTHTHMFHYKVIHWKWNTRPKASYTTLPDTNVWTLTLLSWGNSTHAPNVLDFYRCNKLPHNQWCQTAHMCPLVFLRSVRCQRDRVLWEHSRKTSVFLSFPASSSHLPFLARGPFFYLKTWQHSIFQTPSDSAFLT